jgi:hypothetical protein
MCTRRHCLICKSLTHAGMELSQRELIARAFAGDDVQAEFEEAKGREAEEEAPTVDAPSLLPGWGAWAGQQRTPGWMAKAQGKAQRCCHFPTWGCFFASPHGATCTACCHCQPDGIGSSATFPENEDGVVPHCRLQIRFMHKWVDLSKTFKLGF